MNEDKVVAPEIKCVSNLIKRFVNIVSSEYDLHGLTSQHMRILGYIAFQHNNGSDVFQKDIENQLNIRPSTATVMLKVLEKNGYIIKETVKSDARLKRLILTEKADEITSKGIEIMKEVNNRVTKGIPEENLDIFFSVLEQIKSNLLTTNDIKSKNH